MTTKRLILAAVGVLLYLTLLIVFWAVRPLDDTVPVGTDWTPTTAVSPQPEQLVAKVVECNNLFDSRARPDTPLPELTAQPAGHPALAFQREPCTMVHSDARRNFVINLLVALLALALIVWLGRRARKLAGAEAPPAASSSAA